MVKVKAKKNWRLVHFLSNRRDGVEHTADPFTIASAGSRQGRRNQNSAQDTWGGNSINTSPGTILVSSSVETFNTQQPK